MIVNLIKENKKEEVRSLIKSINHKHFNSYLSFKKCSRNKFIQKIQAQIRKTLEKPKDMIKRPEAASPVILPILKKLA